jgi:hypothetical protein
MIGNSNLPLVEIQVDYTKIQWTTLTESTLSGSRLISDINRISVDKNSDILFRIEFMDSMEIAFATDSRNIVVSQLNYLLLQYDFQAQSIGKHQPPIHQDLVDEGTPVAKIPVRNIEPHLPIENNNYGKAGSNISIVNAMPSESSETVLKRAVEERKRVEGEVKQQEQQVTQQELTCNVLSNIAQNAMKHLKEVQNQLEQLERDQEQLRKEYRESEARLPQELSAWEDRRAAYGAITRGTSCLVLKEKGKTKEVLLLVNTGEETLMQVEKKKTTLSKKIEHFANHIEEQVWSSIPLKKRTHEASNYGIHIILADNTRLNVILSNVQDWSTWMMGLEFLIMLRESRVSQQELKDPSAKLRQLGEKLEENRVKLEKLEKEQVDLQSTHNSAERDRNAAERELQQVRKAQEHVLLRLELSLLEEKKAEELNQIRVQQASEDREKKQEQEGATSESSLSRAKIAQSRLVKQWMEPVDGNDLDYPRLSQPEALDETGGDGKDDLILNAYEPPERETSVFPSPELKSPKFVNSLWEQVKAARLNHSKAVDAHTAMVGQTGAEMEKCSQNVEETRKELEDLEALWLQVTCE